MIPLADLKAWLGVTGADDDQLLGDLERRMVARVEAHTGRYLGEPQEFIQVLDGLNRERLWLRDEPIGELEVSLRSSPTESWVPLDTAGIEREGRAVYLKSGRWPSGRRNVRAVYTAGFAAESGPAEETQVVLELVARSYISRGSETVVRERLDKLEVEYRPLKDIPDPLTTLKRRIGVA